MVRISALPGRREIMQLKERIYLADPLTPDVHLVGALMELIQRCCRRPRCRSVADALAGVVGTPIFRKTMDRKGSECSDAG